MLTELLVDWFGVGVEVGAFVDSDGVEAGVVSLGGEFMKGEEDGCLFLLVGEVLGWVEQGDADMNRGWFGDDPLVCGFVGGGSSQGRPGECAGLFEVVGVSAKGGVEVFSDHDAGFYGVVFVVGFYECVYLLVGVLVLLYRDDLCSPTKVVFYCGDVCVDRGENFGVVVVLW